MLRLRPLDEVILQQTRSRPGWPLTPSSPHSWVESWPLLPRRVRGLPSIQAGMWQSRSCPVFGRLFPVMYPRLALLPKVSCKAHQEWNALYPHARHSRVSAHYQRCWLDQNNQFHFRGVSGIGKWNAQSMKQVTKIHGYFKQKAPYDWRLV